MQRIGPVFCVGLTFVFLFFEFLFLDISASGTDYLFKRVLQMVEPEALATFVHLFIVFLGVFAGAAILCTVWNRVAPHILAGASLMTLSEGYAIMLVMGMIT